MPTTNNCNLVIVQKAGVTACTVGGLGGLSTPIGSNDSRDSPGFGGSVPCPARKVLYLPEMSLKLNNTGTMA